MREAGNIIIIDKKIAHTHKHYIYMMLILLILD